jgi:hypothetical protein
VEKGTKPELVVRSAAHRLGYPLDPEVALIDPATDRPVIGVVVSFPDSATAQRRLYFENTVRRREEQG